jgi:hypothetical protein
MGREEGDMFQFGDLFQWERFITPSIIKIFYWLALAIAVLAGLQGLFGGLMTMIANPILGILAMIGAVLMTFAGIILARIAAEFVLIVFRINEHLGAIRNQGEPQ